MNIRDAVEPDVKGIKSCVESAYRHYIERMGKPPMPMLTDYRISIKNNDVYVVEDKAMGIVGVLVLVISNEEFQLDNIAVHTSAQGKGVGKALLQLAEKTASESGFDHIELYTHEKMQENIALYKRIGYKISGRVSEYGYDRVYMKKLLIDV